METELWKPNRCPKCGVSTGNFFYRNGFYINSQKTKRIPKYQCKSCGKYFSKQTFDITYRQRKSLYGDIIRLLCNFGMSFRGIASILKVQLNTVMKHYYKYLAWARDKHQELLCSGKLKTKFIQVDEMFHCYKSKKNKVNIAIAIKGKTSEIIDIYVEDGSGFMKKSAPSSIKAIKLSIKQCLIDGETTISTDQHPFYPAIFKDLNLKAHQKFKAGTKLANTKLQSINGLMSQMRHRIARLRSDRRSLAQKREKLQEYLDIYIAFHNEYKYIN